MDNDLIIELPDGFNGHTERFYTEAECIDGNLVKIRCATLGKTHCIKWVTHAQLTAAINAARASQ